MGEGLPLRGPLHRPSRIDAQPSDTSNYPMMKAITLHLALVAAGWGFVTALSPLLPIQPRNAAGTAPTAPTKTNRPRPDVAGGQRLLERIKRELPPPAPTEPSPYFGLSIDEKTDRLIAQDPYSGQPTSGDAYERYRKKAILGQIGGIVNGSDGPDYSYAFRHGRMEAQEILELVATRLPEHATDPYFPVLLYHCLVRQDPRRAEPLLADLPYRERARQHDSLLSGGEPILSPTAPRAEVAAQSAGYIFLAENPVPAPDPDFAFALLASIPWEGERYRRFDRQWVWRTCAREFSGSYRDDYFAWLESLPPGRERELAIQRAHEASPSSGTTIYSSRRFEISEDR